MRTAVVIDEVFDGPEPCKAMSPLSRFSPASSLTTTVPFLGLSSPAVRSNLLGTSPAFTCRQLVELVGAIGLLVEGILFPTVIKIKVAPYTPDSLAFFSACIGVDEVSDGPSVARPILLSPCVSSKNLKALLTSP